MQFRQEILIDRAVELLNIHPESTVEECLIAATYEDTIANDDEDFPNNVLDMEES